MPWLMLYGCPDCSYYATERAGGSPDLRGCREFFWKRRNWNLFGCQTMAVWHRPWEHTRLPVTRRLPTFTLICMAPKSSSTAPPATQNPVQTLWKAYINQTSDRLKFVDAFLVFLMLSGVVQFLYCVLVTNYPFNAFLAG